MDIRIFKVLIHPNKVATWVTRCEVPQRRKRQIFKYISTIATPTHKGSISYHLVFLLRPEPLNSVKTLWDEDMEAAKSDEVWTEVLKRVHKLFHLCNTQPHSVQKSPPYLLRQGLFG